jgi:hypothetical protein
MQFIGALLLAFISSALSEPQSSTWESVRFGTFNPTSSFDQEVKCLPGTYVTEVSSYYAKLPALVILSGMQIKCSDGQMLVVGDIELKNPIRTPIATNDGGFVSVGVELATSSGSAHNFVTAIHVATPEGILHKTKFVAQPPSSNYRLVGFRFSKTKVFPSLLDTLSTIFEAL